MTQPGKTVEPAHLQAEALKIAAARVNWLLEGQEGPGPDLAAGLEALVPAGRVALSDVIRRFRLSALQQDLFLLSAAPELGPDTAARLAAHPLSMNGRATPALANQLLGPEATVALAETGLLRQSALLRLGGDLGFAQRPLSLPANVVQFLYGQPEFDSALQEGLMALPAEAPRETALSEAIIKAHRQVPQPILHVTTNDVSRAQARVAEASASLGLSAFAFDPAAMAPGLTSAEIARRLNRDLVLSESCICLADTEEGCRIADLIHAPLILWGRAPKPTRRPLASLSLHPKDDPPPPPPLCPIQQSLALGPGDLRNAEAAHSLGFSPSVWTVARSRAAHDLEALAERITPQASWDDLVLPDAQIAQLKQLAAYRRHRDQVLGDWGFREKSARGLALTALFSGPSGTGKTMAAEILARDLGPKGDALDLFRIDLSAVISKYIGETEKNIGQVFDAAEKADAVLIFDEGEALFAKRTANVKDSLDRHANSETAYLLQRLEAYSGVAIVTTNLKSTVDEAFLRRFRAVVDFPFPDAALRAKIWRAVIPRKTPADDLDFEALGRLAITGGFIRSITLTAAFMAAEAGSPVTMALLERASRQEYGKLGKSISESEFRGFR